jgi:hypothetical protein
MAKEVARTITEDSIGRILPKMRPADVPAEIDKVALVRELQRCADSHSIRGGAMGFRLTKKSLTKLRRLRHMLRDLRKDPETPWRTFSEETAKALRSETIIADLSRVLECSPTPRRGANPTELLVGQDLPLIFKGFFGREAKRSRSDDQTLYRGPYLDFAQAVLDEMGISYRNESISRALTTRGHRRQR